MLALGQGLLLQPQTITAVAPGNCSSTPRSVQRRYVTRTAPGDGTRRRRPTETLCRGGLECRSWQLLPSSDFFEEAVDDAMKSRGVSASEGRDARTWSRSSRTRKAGQSSRANARASAHPPPRRGAPHARARGTLRAAARRSGTASSTRPASSPTTSRPAASTRRTSSASAGPPTRTPARSSARQRLATRRKAPTSSASSRRVRELRRRHRRGRRTRPSRSGVATSRGLLKLYERWLKTRSDRLADALSSHGFVAPRGGGRRPVVSGRDPAARQRTSKATGSSREIALASRVQRGLENLYRLDRAAERRRLRPTHADDGEREALLVRETEDGVLELACACRAARATSTSRTARLDPVLPDHRGRQPLRLPRRPRVARAVRRRSSSSSSQAEVDKYVVLAASIQASTRTRSRRLRERALRERRLTSTPRTRWRASAIASRTARAPLHGAARAGVRRPRAVRRASRRAPPCSSTWARARSCAPRERLLRRRCVNAWAFRRNGDVLSPARRSSRELRVRAAGTRAAESMRPHQPRRDFR